MIDDLLLVLNMLYSNYTFPDFFLFNASPQLTAVLNI
jgi:hypothetical protein